MEKNGNEVPTSEHASIPTDDVQLLIDRRMAYLIDKEKEEAIKMNSDSKTTVQYEPGLLRKWFGRCHKNQDHN